MAEQQDEPFVFTGELETVPGATITATYEGYVDATGRRHITNVRDIQAAAITDPARWLDYQRRLGVPTAHNPSVAEKLGITFMTPRDASRSEIVDTDTDLFAQDAFATDEAPGNGGDGHG